MPMLIDDSGARRLASKLVPQQLQEERDRFRSAVNKAQSERAKASDDKRFDSIGPQERLVVVEQGDRLLEIAAETNVELDEIATVNPQLENVDFIRTGEVLFLPPPSPTEIAARPDGLDVFRDGLYQRGNAIEYADADSTDHRAEIDMLTDDTVEFLSALPDGYREIATQHLFDHDWTDAGPAQMAIEQAADQIGQELKHSTHQGPELENEVRDVLANLGDQVSPQSALAALDMAYATAKPDVQSALLRAPAAREIISQASDYVMSALDDKPKGALDISTAELELASRLNTMSMTLSPEMRTRLFESVVPALEEEYTQRAGTDDALTFGFGGTEQMFDAIKRLDPARDQRSIEGLAEIGIWHHQVVHMQPAEGGMLAYMLEIATPSEPQLKNDVFNSVIAPGFEQDRRETSQRIEEYQQHFMELSWLSENGGAVMTDEQLEQAVSDFTVNNPEWSATADELRARIAQEGEQYIEQLSVLEARYPELFNAEGGEMAERLEQLPTDSDREIAKAYLEHLDSPEVTMSMRMAIEEKPALMDDGLVMQRVGQFGKMTDRGRKFVEEVASLYVRREMIPALVDFNSKDFGSRALAHENLSLLKSDNFAKLLGVSPKSLDNAVAAIEDTWPNAGTFATEADWNARLKTMDRRLGSVRAFQADMPGGLALRLVGVAGASVSLANSGRLAIEDPNFATVGKALFESVGLAQKGIEIAAAYSDKVAATSAAKLFGSSRAPAVKVLGSVTSAFDFYSAYKAAESGDTRGAVLYSVSGAGGIAAAAGSGSWLGPVGITVSVAATIAIMQHQKAQYASQYETPETINFLTHAGLSERSAEILSNQSGEGYSVLPLIARYAEHKGLDLSQPADQAELVTWLNGMPDKSLEMFRDNMHRVLDQQKNDVDSFPATDEKGDRQFAEGLENWDLRYNTTHATENGHGYPRSFAQLDMTLEVLGVEPLV
ncbi:LysM peptidoglycan-binding domain-containing protein [Pseudomonas sp. Marseille-QA0892]